MGDLWAAIHDPDGWTLVESRIDGEWRAIQIDQEFGLDEVGILLQILQPLAEARIPIMAYSTYRTDYVFVNQNLVEAAVIALQDSGHEVAGI